MRAIEVVSGGMGLRRIGLCLAASCLLAASGLVPVSLVSSPALAQGDRVQDFSTDDLFRDVYAPRRLTVRNRPRPELDPLGLRLGSFLLFPRVDLTLEHQDNTFRQPRGKDPDYIARLQPSFNLNSDWNRHAFNAQAGFNAGRYQDNDREDYEDAFFNFNGRYDISGATTAYGGAGYKRQHTPRSSSDLNLTAGAEPTEFDSFDASVGAVHNFGRFQIQGDMSFTRDDFEDTARRNGLADLNNDDTDRNTYIPSVELTYEIQPEYRAFVRGRYIWRDFDDGVDDNGIDRDSDGFEVALGVDLDLGGTAFGEVYVGYRRQDYDDNTLDTISGISWGGRIDWNATKLTTAYVSFSREIVDTTTINSSGRWRNQFAIGVDHELKRNIILSAGATYTLNDFKGIGREDELIGGTLAAEYRLNRHLWVVGEYQHTRRDSSGAQQAPNYTNNTFLLRLTTQL